MASDAPQQPRDAEASSAYLELLRESRDLGREQREARDAWYTKLTTEQKENSFEFEVLLKGLACFANPRNHPGGRKRQTIVAQDFRTQLEHACDGMARGVQLARMMLGERDRAVVLQRYLDTVRPEDNSRTKHARAATAPESPEGSLFELRQSLTNLIEVGSALARSSRVTYRVFFAHLSTAAREISGSVFFNPMVALEFRPEFDRITSPMVLDQIHDVAGEHAHHLVALTFLSLFRMLKYVRLLDAIALDPSDKRVWGRSYLVLAVLRSDARALSTYLQRWAGELLAKDFEERVMRASVSQIDAAEAGLQAEGRRLSQLKAALLSVASMLRLEMRRVFEHDIPPAHDKLPAADVQVRLQGVTETLRAVLQLAVVLLGRTLDASFDESHVFDAPGALHGARLRFRVGAWMFAQIARAFASKARHADPLADTWSTPERYGFVRDFLGYCRAMGHPVLVLGGYERTRELMAALAALHDTDLIDPTRLDAAARECEALYGFSMQLYVGLSQRELSGVPFDRHAAVRLLKQYIGD